MSPEGDGSLMLDLPKAAEALLGSASMRTSSGLSGADFVQLHVVPRERENKGAIGKADRTQQRLEGKAIRLLRKAAEDWPAGMSATNSAK